MNFGKHATILLFALTQVSFGTLVEHTQPVKATAQQIQQIKPPHTAKKIASKSNLTNTSKTIIPPAPPTTTQNSNSNPLSNLPPLPDLFASENKGNYQVISGHGYKYAEISLENISRIVCNNTISTLIYSKLSHMEITKADQHNLFIQLLPIKETIGNNTKLLISNKPRELFVKCGDRMFSLILIPKNIPTATIILKSSEPKEDMNTIESLLGGTSFSNQMSTLIVYAYKEVPPPGFRVENVYKPYRNFEQLSMDIVRVYKGGPYKITEYLINAKQNITLYEGMFIPYLKNPLAIAIVTPKLAKGQSTRMIVVSERNSK